MGKRKSSKRTRRRTLGDPPGMEEEEDLYLDTHTLYNNNNNNNNKYSNGAEQPINVQATNGPYVVPTAATATAVPEKMVIPPGNLIGRVEVEEETIEINEDSNGKAEEEEEEDEPEYEMEEDVYTLIFLYGFSFVSLYSLATVALQGFIIFLFYIDLFKDNTEINKLNVPAAVDQQVLIAQFLALPLAVMSHEDCTTAIYHLSAEYDSKIEEQFPKASRLGWNMTLFLRFFIGFLLVFVSFVQIVQSTTITDLFLNLEAIVFVGNIDNFAFWLAEKNFIKQEFKESCERVKDVGLQASKGKRQTIVRRIGGLITLGILIAGWSVVVDKQKSGLFLKDKACNSFDVSFADYTLNIDLKKITEMNATDPNELRLYFAYYSLLSDAEKIEMVYSAFSGTYRLGLNADESLEIIERRPVYYEDVPGFDQTLRHSSLGKFFYCDEAWVFTVEAFQEAFEREDDPEDLECGRWLLRSQPTDAFFLEEVSLDNWRVWTGSVDTAQDISIICNDCQKSVDCNYHGACIDKVCVCESTGFGPTCGLDPPCLQLNAIEAGESSSEYSENELPPFDLLKRDGTPATEETPAENLLLIYGRPVYSSPLGGASIVIYYLGSRWNIAVWLDDNFEFVFLRGEAPAHAFWNQLFADSGYFNSLPTKSGTPVGVTWEASLFSKSRGNFGPFLAREEAAGLAFNCVSNDCSGLSLCGNFGACVDGRCLCDGCYGGYYCEYGPDEDYAIEDFKSYIADETYTNEYVERFFLGRNCSDAALEVQQSEDRSRVRRRRKLYEKKLSLKSERASE